MSFDKMDSKQGAKFYFVYLLKKILYDLKQAARQWYKFEHLNLVLKKNNNNNFYTCPYCSRSGGNDSLYILLYVDNILY